MKLRISGWTEKHAVVAAAIVVCVVACLVGLLEPRPYQLVVAAIVAPVAVVSLALDGFGGFLVGLIAAAALIAMKRVAGDWVSQGFWVAFAETGVLLLGGATCGAAGTRLRPRSPARALSSSGMDPVYGSLGLLGYDAALARLDDEVDRAARHHRPLTLVRLSVEVTAEEGQKAALRAVARLLESRLRESDVPFAIAPDDLGAILPETNAAAAWEVIGALVDATRDATYTVRGDEARQERLVDTVQLHFGMATLRSPGESADDLMDAATDALRRRGVVQL